MKIYCCQCATDVDARLTNGAEIYPRRPDLRDIPMWRCDTCGNYAGCHHKTKSPTAPLGCIPTPKISSARKHLHALIDPAWKSGRIARKALYAAISARIGREYHSAGIRTIEEARAAYRAAREIIAALPDERSLT